MKIGDIETRKKILAFSTLGKGQGGAETTFEIIKEEIQNRGHLVVPVYNDTQESTYWGICEERGGYRASISLANWWHHVLRPWGVIQALASFVNAIRVLRAEGIGVLYVHYFDTSALIFAFLKTFFQYRFVIGCQGTDIEDVNGLNKKFAPFILNQADAVTSVSNSQFRTIQNQFEIETPVYVIHNGIDVGFWEVDHGRVSDGKKIISVGAIRKEKGHDVLIRAFRQVVNRFPDASLTIVGDGSYSGVCEKLIDDLGLRSSVKITGWRERADIRDLLESADIFAFPSRQEAFGLALVEAMASGLPVVASNVGGIPEVTKGTGAYLVEPENDQQLASALLNALENKDWRKRSAQASIERAREFSLQVMVDQCERVITGAV